MAGKHDSRQTGDTAGKPGVCHRAQPIAESTIGNGRMEAQPANPKHLYRLRTIVTLWLSTASVLFSAAPKPGAAAAKPSATITRALGCLLSQPGTLAHLRELHLQAGDSAWIRYHTGTIPGWGPTPGESFIAVYSGDQKRAWLLLALPEQNGRFQPVANAYRLRQLQHAWQADEGNGGLSTYRTMSRFAAWLTQHRRGYRVRLQPHPEFCSGPEQ